jgi:hypothetical protein
VCCEPGCGELGVAAEQKLDSAVVNTSSKYFRDISSTGDRRWLSECSCSVAHTHWDGCGARQVLSQYGVPPAGINLCLTLFAAQMQLPKLTLLVVFSTIVMDVMFSYGPLFPIAQFTLATSFLSTSLPPAAADSLHHLRAHFHVLAPQSQLDATLPLLRRRRVLSVPCH